MGTSSGVSSGIDAQNKQQQALTNESIGQINNAFAGFTPKFYQGVQDSYTNYALPQLQQQYQTANNQLGYKMAGQGLLDSSAATQGQNALSSAMNTGQINIGNEAVNQSNTMKQTVESERANLIGQAQTASSPSAMGTQALATAAGTQAPSTFAPIGQMFTQFGNQYLNNQSANMYNNFANQYLNSTSNPAIFGTGTQNSFQSLPSNRY